MMRLKQILRDERGAVAVEFSLLGPLMITLMLGVVQIGMAMMSYNSLRSVANEAARYTVVNYQNANKMTTTQVGSVTRALATTGAYNLQSSRLTVTVTTPTTQRVTGAKEMSLKLDYNVPTILALIGVGDIPMTYTRPIFVVP